MLALRAAAHLGLVGVVVGCASLAFDTTVRASTYSTAIAQLQAQEATLQGQLQSQQGQASQDSSAAAQTQQEIGVTETQLATAQGQLTRANLALSQTEDKLAVTEAQMSRDRLQLAELVTQLYQQDGSNTLTNALANTSGVNQFLDDTLAIQNLRQQFSVLTQQLDHDETSLKSLRARQQSQQQQVADDVSSLETKTAQLQVEQATFASEAATLSGQAAQTASEAQQVSQKIQVDQAAEIAAAYSLGTPGSANAEEGTVLAVCSLGSEQPACPTGSYTNNFPFGQCTWYVATQMNVSWSGNAYQWYADAAAAGASVGQTLTAGAAVVFSRGGAYDPYDGHVAWVVAVLGPHTFVVDEANFLSGRADEREISTLSGVVGFIYS